MPYDHCVLSAPCALSPKWIATLHICHFLTLDSTANTFNPKFDNVLEHRNHLISDYIDASV
jgi:hypothetical protein